MKNTRRAGSWTVQTLLFATAVFIASASQAHHSGAMYDDKQTLSIEGAVTKFEWSNPHVYIYLKQATAAGPAIEWELEASPPSILRRLGWSQDTLHAGDTITVTGHPARDAARKSLLPTLIKKGDTTLFDRKGELARLESAGAAPAGSVGGLELDGVWVTLLALKIEEQLDPEKLSLTAKGKTAFKHFDEKKNHPGANCVPFPAPFFMSTPDLKRITKGDGVILIDGEFDGAQRIIHMNAATHDGASDSVQGHSVGRWEDKSLVIDTTHFTGNAMGNAYGLPSGPRKHLLERLTPDGKGALTYHFELSDPEFLAAPVVGDVQWVYRPNLAYAPLKCDLENARRYATH
ncbi:MAG TPA: DUF6152 family protein [Steroidobacteraceae bacterium]|jgi:hypothetical protein